MQLRPYQLGAVDRIRAEFRAGRRRVCLIAPTGAGKTIMAAHVITETARRGHRVVVIAHRKELVDQTVDKLARFGVQAGVVMGSDARFDDYQPVQVCSIQTLARRLDCLPPATLIAYDEVHHALSESSQKVLAAYPEAFLIGLTATPWRTDKRGLGDLFEAAVVAATPAELMALGSLVPYDPFSYDAPDLHEVGLVAGEFNQKQLGIACNTSVLVGSIVREYLQHAGGRRGIVFPVDVAHSKHLVQEFVAAGVRAEHLDCDTPKEERERILGGLSSGAVTLVSSVGVLTEGFDAPPAEVCILARPTKSLGLYMQMVGRVLRPSPDTGKTRALIHDHGGNILRHGFPDDDRDYSLTATPARVRELATCPFCHAVIFRSKPDGSCPKCREIIAEPRAPGDPEPVGGREKEVVEGTRLDRAGIEALRGKLMAGGVERALSDEQVVRVAKATREQKAAEYLRLERVREQKNFQKGFVGHQFRGQFGHWPRFKDAELAGVEPAAKPFLPLPPAPARSLDLPKTCPVCQVRFTGEGMPGSQWARKRFCSHACAAKSGGGRPEDTRSNSERFWAKVERTDSCWRWSGSKDKDGYGKFTESKASGQAQRRAHIVSWSEARGPIPDGKRLINACGDTLCVRPEHWALGDHRDAALKSRGQQLPEASNG